MIAETGRWSLVFSGDGLRTFELWLWSDRVLEIIIWSMYEEFCIERWW